MVSIVIAVIDSTVLTADFFLRGKEWQICVQRPSSWNLRLTTTVAVVEEVVGNLERSAALARSNLDKKRNEWERIGLNDEIENLFIASRVSEGNYRSKLLELLSTARIEVLRLPEVEHIELVRRAVQRQRPCDDKGDGYRDTLLWLGVLELARESEGENVILVTSDSDFLEGDPPTSLHSTLIQEAENAALTSTVGWRRSIVHLILELAVTGEHTDPSVDGVLSDLRSQAISIFVNEVVTANSGRSLNPEDCGMPYGVTRCVLESSAVLEVNQLTSEPRGDGKSTVTVQAVVDADLAVVLAEGFSIEGDSSLEAASILDASEYRLTRTLQMNIDIQVDRFGRPHMGYMTAIARDPSDRHAATLIRRVRGNTAARNVGVPVGEFRPLQDEAKRMTEQFRPLQDEAKRMTEQFRPLQDEAKRMIEQFRPLQDEIKKITDQIRPSQDEATDDPAETEPDDPAGEGPDTSDPDGPSPEG